MARFGFCGPSYPSQVLGADAQACINLYLERNESESAKSPYSLLSRPGLKQFTNPALGGPSIRGEYYFQGRLFAASGAVLYEVFADGTSHNRGAVADDGGRAYFAGNNANQLFIVAGGSGYCYNLNTNILTLVGLLGPAAQCGFSDGYFIALLKDGRFQVSNLEDGLTWVGTEVAIPSVFPDAPTALICDHRELWIAGPKNAAAYYNSGNPDFPFEPIPGGFAEQGIGAPDTPTKLDNSVFWWGADERGAGIAWRAQGYVPARVSNHAIENAVQGYPTIADAVSYSYQERGHTFWVTYFPSANGGRGDSWAFDVATGQWHQPLFWDAAHGYYLAHRARCHAFAFGKHLVGDWKSGTIYEQAAAQPSGAAWAFCDDFGNALRWVRRAPYVALEAEWMRFHELRLDMEAGLGPQPPLLDGAGNARDPMINLRWSDDGAHTWSNEHAVGIGQAGKFKTPAVWRRLGRSRGRVFEVNGSDPVPVRITDAYLKATPGYGAQERLATQMRKGA